MSRCSKASANVDFPEPLKPVSQIVIGLRFEDLLGGVERIILELETESTITYFLDKTSRNTKHRPFQSVAEYAVEECAA